jgi:zinc-binding alcohol dehydrogenase/oxidoreductase
MKAVVLRELGEPDQLKIEEIPDPEPKKGEVIVQLKSAALNRRDVWIRRGRYANLKLPIVPGSDGSGIIVETGEEVDYAILGKEVVINPCLDWGSNERVQRIDFRILGLPDNGTYAEYVSVPAENVYAKPDNLSWEEAAALPLAGLTAYRALVSRANIQQGQRVLITGIGGGVASFALQISKKIGAHIYVTSGHDDKLERAQEIGAEGGVNYKQGDWVSDLKEMIGSDGIDVVVDSAGGENFDALLDITKPGGTIVTYGSTLGPSDNVNIRRIFWKQLNILGSTMGSPGDFRNMLKFYSENNIKPVIDSVFPLKEAYKAHTRMENSSQFGKLVLKISP